MGEIVDLRQEREKRQADKDRAASKAYVPTEVPLIDSEWDDEAGQSVETVHVPGWSAPFHTGRDFGDEPDR